MRNFAILRNFIAKNKGRVITIVTVFLLLNVLIFFLSGGRVVGTPILGIIWLTYILLRIKNNDFIGAKVGVGVLLTWQILFGVFGIFSVFKYF